MTRVLSTRWSFQRRNRLLLLDGQRFEFQSVISNHGKAMEPMLRVNRISLGDLHLPQLWRHLQCLQNYDIRRSRSVPTLI